MTETQGLPPTPRLHVGLSTTLIHALRHELLHCTSANLAVAFLMASGLDFLEGALRAAALSGARIRFLTSDYLGVTETGALRRLFRGWCAGARRIGISSGILIYQHYANYRNYITSITLLGFVEAGFPS